MQEEYPKIATQGKQEMGLVLIKNYVFVAVAIALYQISRTLPPFSYTK